MALHDVQQRVHQLGHEDFEGVQCEPGATKRPPTLLGTHPQPEIPDDNIVLLGSGRELVNAP